MKKRSYKARDFLLAVSQAERSEADIVRIVGLSASSVTASIQYPLEEFYQQGREQLAALAQVPAADGIDPVASAAYNYFALCVSRKAPEAYIREFAEKCLDALGLLKPEQKLLTAAWYQRSGLRYRIVRSSAAHHQVAPDRALEEPYLFELYKGDQRLAVVREDQLSTLAITAEDHTVFQVLLERIQGVEQFPVLQAAGRQGTTGSVFLELLPGNISAAIQCTLRYAQERGSLLNFFTEKEWPVRFTEVSRARITSDEGPLYIYSDATQWKNILEMPKYSYTYRLLGFVEPSLLLAKLSRTVMIKTSDEGLLEEASSMVQHVPAKEMPDPTVGETEIITV